MHNSWNAFFILLLQIFNMDTANILMNFWLQNNDTWISNFHVISRILLHLISCLLIQLHSVNMNNFFQFFSFFQWFFEISVVDKTSSQWSHFFNYSFNKLKYFIDDLLLFYLTLIYLLKSFLFLKTKYLLFLILTSEIRSHSIEEHFLTTGRNWKKN